MKKLLLIFISCVLLPSSPLSAKDIKIKVSSQGEPLGYAYVFVNGKAYAATDSLGVTYLPQNRLQPGDTLSASYVGMQDAFFICPPEGIPSDSLLLDLKRNYALDEVVVSVDARKLFKKYVRPQWPLYANHKLKMEFVVVTQPANLPAPDTVKGSTTIAFNHSPIHMKGWRYTCRDIKTDADTSLVLPPILLALRTAIIGAEAISNPPMEKRAVMSYWGTEGRNRIFTWAYPLKTGMTIQLLIRADRQTKKVNSLILSHLKGNTEYLRWEADFLPDQDKNLILSSVKADFQNDPEHSRQQVTLSKIITEPYRGRW